MIRVEGVTASVPGAASGDAPRAVLRDLNAEFAAGESHLILGSNGSGKTTLVRILAGLLRPSSGRVLVDSVPISADSSERSLWPRVAVVFEEPDPQFLSETVEGEVAFGLESLALPREEIAARTAEAIHAFELDGFEGRAPQTLSAGEKTRVLLAAMSAGRPGALLLDQSLSHLDPGARRALERRLLVVALSSGRAVIRTHQDFDPPHPSERLHILEEGRLVDASRLSPQAVLDATDIPLPLAMRVSAMLAVGGAWSGPPAMDATPVGSGLGGELILALRGVSFEAPGPGARVPIVADIDLELRAGSVTGLIGLSGSGKSTILKLAAGVLEPTRGTIERTGDRSRNAALAIEYPERQLVGRTVEEDVAATLWVRGTPAAERTRRAREALDAVGLDPDQFGSRVPIALSEGEKRRVALASLLADPPRAILLDEPTAGLDPAGRRAVSRVVRGMKERGHAVLLASHDLDFVSCVADRAIVLGRGAGGPGGVLAESAVPNIWDDDALLRSAQLPPPDYVSVRAALRGLGIAALAGARDADSLLDAVARGLAGRPRVDLHPAVGDTLRDG